MISLSDHCYISDLYSRIRAAGQLQAATSGKYGVRGYPVYGNYAEANPSARIVRAVASDELDLALVWGPLAGYFAALEDPPLTVTPLAASADDGLPFAFDIAMGVRKQDRPLRDLLDEALARRKGDIDRILAEYHVPQVADMPGDGSDR